VAAETGGVVVPTDDASDLLDACLKVFSQVKDCTVMGSGEVAALGMAVLGRDPYLARGWFEIMPVVMQVTD
jgi:hypothetical protein